MVVEWLGPILRVRDESGPMLALNLLVGTRWREFHCLLRCSVAIRARCAWCIRAVHAGQRGRRGAGMKFSQRIS